MGAQLSNLPEEKHVVGYQSGRVAQPPTDSGCFVQYTPAVGRSKSSLYRLLSVPLGTSNSLDVTVKAPIFDCAESEKQEPESAEPKLEPVTLAFAFGFADVMNEESPSDHIGMWPYLEPCILSPYHSNIYISVTNFTAVEILYI